MHCFVMMSSKLQNDENWRRSGSVFVVNFEQI